MARSSAQLAAAIAEHTGMDDKNVLAAIAISLAAGVGSRSGKLLVDRFGSTAAALGAPRRELAAVGLTADQIDALRDPALPDRAVRHLEAIRRIGGEAVALGDPGYAELLAPTYDPPAVLYGKGAWRQAIEAGPVVAIVGSRRATAYGRNVAERLAADLASRGVTIVSGLARGIDAAAHRAAVEAGGRSIGVMGTGLDEVYPREHKKLAERLLERGGLVTEFPLETPPAGKNFPFRNRVIAGLAFAVVVVEAAERSGSLITARLALEAGRDVCAVPGNITSPSSFGPNYLIKDGAALIQTWKDVVATLPEPYRDALLADGADREGSRQPALAFEGEVTANERAVLGHLKADQPRHADSLAATTRLAPGALADALFTLETKGLATALPGGFYVKRF
jgi:DNA processing protein